MKSVTPAGPDRMGRANAGMRARPSAVVRSRGAPSSSRRSRWRIRHLPVVEAGEVIGLVSIGDLVNATLEEQRFHIAQLESYIAGNLG